MIIGGQSDDTAMNHFLGIFSEDLKCHSIPHIMGNSHPPSGLFFGGGKHFIRVKIENLFI
jgi:hypothetical protein